LLEDSPLKHSRRANEAVGSTTTVIQQHLTSFAFQGSELRAEYTLAPDAFPAPPAGLSRSKLALLRLVRRLLKKADGRYLLLYSKKP